MIRLKIRIESSRGSGTLDGPAMELNQESNNWAVLAASVARFIIEYASNHASYILIWAENFFVES